MNKTGKINTGSIGSLWKKIWGFLLALRENLAINCVMLALLGVGTGLISLLLGATVFGLPLFRAYFTSPTLITLNLLPPVLFIFLLYFISGRAWIAFTFPAFITLLLSAVQFFKVQVHGDPFILPDIVVMREVGAVMSDYTLTMNWKVYLAIAAFVCGVLFSVFALKHKIKKVPVRVISSVVIIAICAVLYVSVYTDEKLYSETSGDKRGTTYSAARNHIAKGFIYQFIHSIQELGDSLNRYPDWYSKQEAKRMIDTYPPADIPEDKKVNVVCLMLESYADFSLFDILDFELDVYGPLHRLQAESVSGMVISNAFAGWTIDPERLFLTGNTQLTTYRSSTNSYVQYLRSQGYHTEGLHAGERWFYDRRSVNKHLGFDVYYFLEDFENGSRADSFFFPAVLDLYQARDRTAPYFSYNLSFQGHIGYDSRQLADRNVIRQGGISDESFDILNNYLTGIYDTSWRLEMFVDALRADSEPVVVLVFGDHMPWLGDARSVYAELGINIERSTEEGFFNYYSTPYFIWANDAAKDVLGNDFTGDGGDFSVCFLMGEMFRLCSWEGDGYMQALREIQAHVDVINTPTGIYRENGFLTEELSQEVLPPYQLLRMMEIYRRNNFAY